MAPFVRRAIRIRESSKSELVAVTVAHKVAYRALGAQCVAEGLLPDADLVYFCTHDELGELVAGRRPDLAALADDRRTALAWQESLRFPDVCVGTPEPLLASATDDSSVVTGIPANAGTAVGTARIVHSVADAGRLRAGDILVAPVTDVGWTPWFGVVAAVVTDIGSAVSHGAVVAREFGIPAVVNCGDATGRITEGARVEVDGTRGTITELSAPDAG